MSFLDGFSDTEATLNINKKFAKAYENKKRKEEEAQFVLEESSDESCSDIEDENGDLLTQKIDTQIMKTILLLKSKNPIIYDTTVTMIDDIDDTESKTKIEKPFTLKQHHTRELLGKNNNESEPTYTEGLEAAKSDFIKAANELNAEEDLFVQAEESNADKEYSEFLVENLQKEGVDSSQLNEWKNTKDAEEGFLLDFVLNRGWMDNSKPMKLDDSADEQDLEEFEKMEEFERQHNFRFEEENASELVTHSRSLPNVLRRKDDARILKRKVLKERKTVEKTQKKERLAHLKNLKMMEIAERLEKIRKLAGADVLNVEDIDGDFDPESYDIKMGHEFGENYYDNNSHEKPVFDDEIDIDDLILNEDQGENDFNVDSEPSLKSKKKAKKKKAKASADCEDPDFNMDCDAEVFQPVIVETEHYVDPMEEIYPLEYEDIVFKCFILDWRFANEV
jgi:protein KRI1